MQEQFADRLGPKSAARLLGVSLDDKDNEQVVSDEMIGELLQARLGGMWSPQNGREPLCSRLLRPILCKRGSDRQRTIGGLLLDSQTNVATIKAIRDHAKRRAASEHSEPEHAVMTTIYFAAIASALVFHEAKITTYSYETLKGSFEKLIRKAWMPANLVDLFRQTIEVCQQK